MSHSVPGQVWLKLLDFASSNRGPTEVDAGRWRKADDADFLWAWRPDDSAAGDGFQPASGRVL